MKTINSKVPGHEGLCVPVWLHGNHILERLDQGVSGFFKNLKPYTFLGLTFHYRVGEEFHGVIRNGQVHTTESSYD